MDYVVVAEFRVKDTCIAEFLVQIQRHAALSRAEPGCRVFEVAQDTADPNRILLFERYSDTTAYAAHRASEHYLRFRMWAPPLLELKDGELFQRRSVMKSSG